MKRIRVRVVTALLALLTSFSSSVGAQIDVNRSKAQTSMNNNQTLDVKQQSLVIISAFTAEGDLEKRLSFNFTPTAAFRAALTRLTR
jgi:hypothetical protein